MKKIGLVAGVLLLAACGSSGGLPSSSPPSSKSTFTGPTAVAKALTTAGIECDNLTFPTDDGATIDIGLGLPEPSVSADCDSQGDSLQISIYEKPGQVDKVVDAIDSPILCSFAVSFGQPHLALAYGANWTVDGMSDAPATYADALGGDSATYDCPT